MENFDLPPRRHPAFPFLLFFLYCILCSFLSIQTVQAQLSGQYTIGGTNGDYETFSEALSALDAQGISAPVTFKVRPGIYQEPLQINNFPGNSCTSTVTFENESGENEEVFLDFPPPGSPIVINGADGIIIRNLTISGGTSIIQWDTDCISLENNIIRNSVEISSGPDNIRIIGNTITGNIRTTSGSGNRASLNHHYKDNILSGGIHVLKSINFIPSAPEFDEGLEITGNQLGGRIWLKYQKGIKINHNKISIKERITEGAITLDNCWYGEEMIGNLISVNGVSSGLASGIEAISGIPERVTENRISLSSGPAIKDPGSEEGYSYDYGGGTGMLLSAGKTNSGEVLIANNIITVDGWDRRRAIHSMDGIYIKAGHSPTETIKVYHNSIDIRGFNQEEIYAFKAEPLPENTLRILNNEFIISATYDSPSPEFYTMQIDDPASIAIVDYNIHEGPGPDMAIGENSNPENGKGIYLAEVPRDFYALLRSDPPDIGAVEGEAPTDPTDPTDPVEPGEPLAGTYTIGGNDGDYASFTAAMEALNSRGKTEGELVFRVRPGTYTEQLIFDGINGVTFEGESSDSTAVVLQYFGTTVVHIGSGKLSLRHLTISGTGSDVIKIGPGTKDVTLEGSILKGLGPSVVLAEGTTNLKIENNFIQGEYGTLISSVRSAGQNNADVHHIFRNNILKGGTEGINVRFGDYQYLYGVKGLEISGNSLEGQGKGGIALFGQESALIEDNTIRVEGEANALNWGIKLEKSYFENRINDNDIYLAGGSNGSGITIWGESNPAEIMRNHIVLPDGGDGINLEIYHSESYENDLPLLVANNLISIKADNQSEGIALRDYGGETHYFFNTIHLYGDAPRSIGIRLGGYAKESSLVNNIVSNKAGGQALSVTGGASELPAWLDYNAYYLKEGTVLYGEHDIFADPQFVSDVDLRPANSALDGAGIAVPRVDKDFFGTLRNDPPDIGAIEFEPEGEEPAGPLAGTYTIGGDGADFASFTAAMENLEERGKEEGTVVFKVRPGTYNEFLTVRTAGVVIEGESGDSTQVVLQNTSGTGDEVVNIYSSDVTIKHMTISGAGDTVLSIHAGASNITLESNIIHSTSRSTLINSISSVDKRNNDHRYLNNLLIGGRYGIYKSHRYNHQLGGEYDTGLKIAGNIFREQIGMGIHLNGQSSLEIAYNQMDLNGNGIFFNRRGPGVKINHNEIRAIGNPGGLMGIYTSGSSSLEISNNQVYLPEGGRGIHLPSNDPQNEEEKIIVTNNMVAVKGTNESIGISLPGSANQYLYFNSVHIYGDALESKALFLGRYGENIHLANNNIVNSAGGWAIHHEEDAIGSISSSDYNVLYTTGANMAYWKNEIIPNLQEWKEQTGFDTHSLSVAPHFESAENLSPNNPALYGAGIALEEVDTDIFGNLRNDPPDIGAVEKNKDELTDPLAGTYTIGGEGADFASLGEAVAALQEKGVDGAVTFSIRAGTYTEQVIIGKYPGNACENPVLFESEAGDNNSVFLTASSADFVWQINGADGIGIRNLNISGSGTLVDIRNGADCIIMEYNILTGDEGDGPTLVTAASGNNNTANHHRYIGNTFVGGGGGLSKFYNPGSGRTDHDEGLLVEDNEFRGPSLFLSGQANYQVSNNRLSVANNYWGLTILGSENGGIVDGNNIYVAEGEYGMIINGTPARIVNNQIELNVVEYGGTGLFIEDYSEESRQILVANNIVKVHYPHSFNDYGYTGMNISGNAKVYHNSVMLSQSSNNKGAVASLFGDELQVYNNNFTNLAGESLVVTNAVAMDYNNLYTPNFNLADWQRNTGKDEHSISVRPEANTLHPALSGAGVFLEEVPTDFNGRTRKDPPTIGAIELGLDPHFTIGGEDGDFANFTEALHFLERSLGMDSLVFKVRPGTYHEQLHLSFQNFRHVTFEGESGDSTDVVLEYHDGYALTITDGPHYTFRHMTISGKGAVRIFAENNHGANHITFEQNILKSADEEAVVSTYTIARDMGMTNSSVGDLTLRNNMITGKGWGLQKEGSIIHHTRHGVYTLSDAGLLVSGNHFITGKGGMFITNTRDVTIDHNVLLVGDTSNYNDPVGISIKNCYQLKPINSNQLTIKGAAATGLWIDGSPMGGYFGRNIPDELMGNIIFLPEGGKAIRLEWVSSASGSSGGIPALIANNIISVKGNNGSVGMWLKESYLNIKIVFNSFYIYGEDAQSKVLSFSDVGPEIQLMNNILANSAGGVAINGQASGSGSMDYLTHSDYNAFYTHGENIAHWHGQDIENLEEWQAVTGMDTHSLFADPQFESTEMLIPANPALAGAGIAVAEVMEDYFGEQRTDPPTIGAVEFKDEPEGPVTPEPTNGFVIGGGVFHSPVGAIIQDPQYKGRAIFAFQARKTNKDNRPQGNVSLTIPQARLRFQAKDSYDWISVNENTAILSGTGELNRVSGYHFIISVVDYGFGTHQPEDTYRVIIRDPEGALVYDNEAGVSMYAEATTPIGGGNIMVNPEAGVNVRMYRGDTTVRFTAFKVYPTLLKKEGIWIETPSLEENNMVHLRIVDPQGKELAASTVYLKGNSMKHFWELNSESWSSGVYLLLVQAEGRLYQQKLVK